MEIIEVPTITYKVDKYLFETKEQAERIRDVLKDENKKVCNCCDGVGKAWQARGRSMDNGGEGYTKYFAEYFSCEQCDGRGFLNRKITWH